MPPRRRYKGQLTIDSFLRAQPEPKAPAVPPTTRHVSVRLETQVSQLGPTLDEDDIKWDAFFERHNWETPLHGAASTKARRILVWFDRRPEFGPALSVPRLLRWNRAKDFNLNPPDEVHVCEHINFYQL